MGDIERLKREEEEKSLEYERRRREPTDRAYQLHLQSPWIDHYWMNDRGESGTFRAGYAYSEHLGERGTFHLEYHGTVAYKHRKLKRTTTDTDEQAKEEADEEADRAAKQQKLIERTELEINIWPQLNAVTKAEEEAYAALRRYEKRLLTTRYTGHYEEAIQRIKQTIKDLKAQRIELAERQRDFLQKSGWFGKVVRLKMRGMPEVCLS